MQDRQAGARLGFTLVEILIVVVILGILAAIVIPSFSNAAQDTRKTAFARELRVYSEAILRYQVDHEAWPPDGSSGTVPSGLEDYVNVGKWEGGSPIGGVWDNETEDNTITAGMGVHFDGTGQTRDATFMADIDRILDDGVVGTGKFRQFGTRYYNVLEE